MFLDRIEGIGRRYAGLNPIVRCHLHLFSL